MTSSTHDSEDLSELDGTVDRFAQLSISKGVGEGAKSSEISPISLFAPFSDDSIDHHVRTQMAPKLDAQTLFAFGVSFS